MNIIIMENLGAIACRKGEKSNNYKKDLTKKV